MHIDGNRRTTLLKPLIILLFLLLMNRLKNGKNY